MTGRWVLEVSFQGGFSTPPARRRKRGRLKKSVRSETIRRCYRTIALSGAYDPPHPQ